MFVLLIIYDIEPASACWWRPLARRQLCLVGLLVRRSWRARRAPKRINWARARWSRVIISFVCRPMIYKGSSAAARPLQTWRPRPSCQARSLAKTRGKTCSKPARLAGSQSARASLKATGGALLRPALRSAQQSVWAARPPDGASGAREIGQRSVSSAHCLS